MWETFEEMKKCLIEMLNSKLSSSIANANTQIDSVDESAAPHSEKSLARPMLFYSTNYWQQF